MSWRTVALGDVCKVIAGQSPEGKYYNNDGVGIPFYQGKKDFGKVYINPPSVWTTEITKEAIKDDILMSVRAPVGPVNISRENICIGRGLAAIRSSEKIDKSYLFNYLLSIEKNLIGSSGAVFNSINKGQIEKLEIPLPPLSIQQKIVAKIDAIFAEIDKATAAAEANSKNAEALFQSYLDKLFEEDEISYKKVNIKDVCKIGDGNHSSKYPKKEEMVESGVPFIRSTNIVNGVLSDKDLVYLTEDKHKELKKGHLKTGDVLITNRGEIGKVAIVDERFDNANLNSQIAWLRCNPALLNQYMLFFLMSANMKRFYSDTKTGAALQQLPIGKIEKIQIPLPSLDAQKARCSEFLTIQQKCSLAIFSYENKLIKLSQFKQSILKQAFSGELVKE